MDLARQINKKLDEIIEHNKERKAVELDFQDPNFTLNKVDSGEKVTIEMVLNKADEVKEGIVAELNKLTSDGQRCRNIFQNDYYVNDMSQDRVIAEEMRQNKIKTEQAKQNQQNN